MRQDELFRHVVFALEGGAASRTPLPAHRQSFLYGENRFTNDLDVVADLTIENLGKSSFAFPVRSPFYVGRDRQKDAVERGGGQFNIIDENDPQKVDVIVPANDFDRALFARAKRIASAGIVSNVISPEDLIVKKMDFYREGESEKHLRDIAGILDISGDELDIAYIEAKSVSLGLEKIWNAINARLKEEPPF